MAKNNSEGSTMTGETCPICSSKSLSLTERDDDIPYFGRVSLYSMTCTSCKFHKADVELLEKRDPLKVSIEVSGEKDMKIRVVKSSTAKVRIPYMADIAPGEASNGYVTNVEGILRRVKHQVESIRDTEEDPAAVKKAKNIIKKINRITWGDEKTKIIIEDPKGNSGILDERAIVEKLKVK